MAHMRKHPTRILLAVGLMAILGACAGAVPEPGNTAADAVSTQTGPPAAPTEPDVPAGEPETTASVSGETAPTATAEEKGGPEAVFIPGSPIEPLHTQLFDGVITADVEAAGSGTVFVALGRENGVIIRSSHDDGGTFSTPVVASQGLPLFVRNIERPSIAVDDNGQIGLVWLEGQPDIKVWNTLSTDGGETFTTPQIIDEEQGDGIWLPRITVDENFQSYFAWIEGGTLVFAHPEDGGDGYHTTTVDGEVCECCPPDPVIIDGRMHIAYRDRRMDEQGRWVRDIHVASSPMGAFEDWREVRVSDAPWVIDVCPLSGPTLVEDGDRIYVLWMDGRNDEPNSFNRSDIWLAVSTDGGTTFSENRRLNTVPGAYNNKPVAAVGPDGRLHIAWQAEEGDRGVLYYTYSDDGGGTFATPFEVTVSMRGDPKGLPGNAQISVGADGRVYLLWMDRIGARLWTW